MTFKDIPIRKKVLRILFLINGIVLLVTCVTFFIYEFYIFRKTTIEKLSTIGKIIAANSTAALAFEDPNDAKEILAALKTEPHVVAACLYDKDGKLFSRYSRDTASQNFPAKPEANEYRLAYSHLQGFEPVMQDTRQLGTLYIKSDMGAMYERMRLYAAIATLVIVLSFVMAYLLSGILQKNISLPILALAETAKIIHDQKDYSVRAVKKGNDELGSLTTAFNQMLEQIQVQDYSLKEFNQNLEEKVKDRTIELETVNNELEAFSYSISHDLRAPLRAIIGFTSVLEEDYSSKLDAEAMRITSIIKNNTIKMGHLVDDLLAFSRMSRQDIIKNSVDSNAVVKEAIESSGDHPKVEWIIHSLPSVKADISTIRQVWINVISNAIKYSRTRETQRIEIGSYTNEDQIVFYIKDNGVGFDEQYKDKLFKVFHRLHNAEEFEGTGIGLALVEKIVSKHTGKVWAEAKVNKGATFYFSLPA